MTDDKQYSKLQKKTVDGFNLNTPSQHYMNEIVKSGWQVVRPWMGSSAPDDGHMVARNMLSNY